MLLAVQCGLRTFQVLQQRAWLKLKSDIINFQRAASADFWGIICSAGCLVRCLGYLRREESAGATRSAASRNFGFL